MSSRADFCSSGDLKPPSELEAKLSLRTVKRGRVMWALRSGEHGGDSAPYRRGVRSPGDRSLAGLPAPRGARASARSRPRGRRCWRQRQVRGHPVRGGRALRHSGSPQTGWDLVDSVLANLKQPRMTGQGVVEANTTVIPDETGHWTSSPA